jgi:hypothetical protein
VSERKSSIDEVLSSLSSFSREQLEQIEAKIRFLKSTGLTTVTVPETDTDLMLTAISDFFSGQGLEHTTAAMLRKAASFKALQNNMIALTQYLQRAAGTLSRTERLLIYRTSVQLLYVNMTKMGIPTSARSIMTHSSRIPAVLNRAFPGYAKLGALHLIVNRATTNRIEHHGSSHQ